MTSNTIIDETGVEMAGPDEKNLAVAKAREAGGAAFANLLTPATVIEGGAIQADQIGNHRGISREKVLLGGAVGRVSPAQAGILEMGPMPITEDMVRRAREASPGLDAATVRTMLEAALHG